MTPISHEQFLGLIAHFEGPPLTLEAADGVTYEAWVTHFHDCQTCSDAVLTYRLEQRGVNPTDYACVHMAYRATETCEQHPDRSECPDLIVEYTAKFDEYAIIKYDVSLTIDYCPWCGIRLPPSQRDRWFDEVRALGLKPGEDDAPEAYRTGAWFKLAPKREQS